MNGYRRNSIEATGEKEGSNKKNGSGNPDHAPENSEEDKKEKRERPPLKAETLADRIALCEACGEKMLADIPVLRGIGGKLMSGAYWPEGEGAWDYIQEKKTVL